MAQAARARLNDIAARRTRSLAPDLAAEIFLTPGGWVLVDTLSRIWVASKVRLRITERPFPAFTCDELDLTNAKEYGELIVPTSGPYSHDTPGSDAVFDLLDHPDSIKVL